MGLPRGMNASGHPFKRERKRVACLCRDVALVALADVAFFLFAADVRLVSLERLPSAAAGARLGVIASRIAMAQEPWRTMSRARDQLQLPAPRFFCGRNDAGCRTLVQRDVRALEDGPRCEP